jgi:hypothetical protein
MSHDANPYFRDFTMELPEGGQLRFTIALSSVVVVPVPPPRLGPGEAYLMQPVSPETKLELTVQFVRA